MSTVMLHQQIDVYQTARLRNMRAELARLRLLSAAPETLQNKHAIPTLLEPVPRGTSKNTGFDASTL